jgi:hypothetical protein
MDGVRGRKQLQERSVGAQGLPTRALVELLPHTVDLDMENCAFVIVDQLLDKLGLPESCPQDIRETIRRCAWDREGVCTTELKCSVAAGKPLLNAVVNAKGLQAPHDDNLFLASLTRASRYMRWLACSVLPGVYKEAADDPTRRFPEATTFYRLWTAVEDAILTEWCSFAMRSSPSHLSLHYDGIRVHKDLGMPVEEFCRQCEAHILETVGFKVSIREKKHQYFLELLSSWCETENPVPDVPPVFKKPGNCIISAALHLKVKDQQTLLDYLSDTGAQHNLQADRRRSRAYSEMESAFGVALVPIVGCADLAPGRYLLHCEPRGRPHCLAVMCTDGCANIEVFDVDTVYLIPAVKWNDMCFAAVDKSGMVLFQVFDSAASAHWPSDITKSDLLPLLEMRAGGQDRPCAKPLRPLPNLQLDEDFVYDVSGDQHASMESDSEPESLADDATEDVDEAVVYVGDSILQSMKKEVAATLKELNKQSRVSSKGCVRCPLCPFRRFKGGGSKGRLIQHISKYHTEGKQFCCSGTKQIKVASVIINRCSQVPSITQASLNVCVIKVSCVITETHLSHTLAFLANFLG